MDLYVLPRSHHDRDYLGRIALCVKELRLRSLLADPEAFSSTYTFESEQPFDFWEKRLQNPTARHFVIAKPRTMSKQPNPELDLSSYEWLAILAVLGPQAVNPSSFDNESSWKACLDRNRNLGGITASASKSALMYHIVGVWVAPEARRQGLAKKMIDGAVEFIKKEVVKQRARYAICTLGVLDTAIAAQNLYQACGFSKVAEDCYETGDGQRVRDFVMRKDIGI